MKLERMDDHVIITITRQHASIDVPTHGNVDDNLEITHPPRPRGYISLHNRPAINIPHQAAARVAMRRLLPSKAIPPALGVVQLGDGGLDDAMLVPVLAVEVAPVQAGVVDAGGVPGLEDVHLAVVGPGKGLARQQPEGGPDAGRRGGREAHLQEAAVAAEGLVRGQAGAGVLVARGRGGVDDGAEDKGLRGRVEGVSGVGEVVLLFVVAPAVVAQLVLEV